MTFGQEGIALASLVLAADGEVMCVAGASGSVVVRFLSLRHRAGFESI